MSRIDTENAKILRPCMEVYAGLSARMRNVDLTIQISGDIGAVDTNISTSIDSENWNMRKLTDLSGEGFSLDGKRSLYDTQKAGSESDGKVGLRTSLGGTVTAIITASSNVSAITLAFTGDNPEGAITANGVNYDARRIVVIPVNSTGITLQISSTNINKRLEIASITPGISFSFSNNNLVLVSLTLRADLAIDNPTFPVSEIEIKAFWPDEISEAISNIGDDVPIWYYAGYQGNYSPVRYFYLSQAASMTGNVITLKGEDSASKLEDSSYIAQCINSKSGNGNKVIYEKFVSMITDAGISLISKEVSPAATSTGSSYALILKEGTSRDFVADIINLCHYGTFWPVFVDGGRPEIKWKKPTPKWNIYEENCGEVVRNVERNIAKIKSDDENGLQSIVTKKTTLDTLVKKDVTAGKSYSYDADGYYWYMSVSNAKSALITAARAVWRAAKSTTKKKKNKKTVKQNQCIVKGKKAVVAKENSSIAHAQRRPGYTMQASPIAYGKIYEGTTLTYPAFVRLFDRNNITGSFKFRGDPRMQPRDVFNFHRLDGKVEDCTIQTISLTHEEGGTIAEISYRKGIV